ncbi:hypothetical protein GN956_G19265 [Arapaima gigas]
MRELAYQPDSGQGTFPMGAMPSSSAVLRVNLHLTFCRSCGGTSLFPGPVFHSCWVQMSLCPGICLDRDHNVGHCLLKPYETQHCASGLSGGGRPERIHLRYEFT